MYTANVLYVQLMVFTNTDTYTHSVFCIERNAFFYDRMENIFHSSSVQTCRKESSWMA